MTVPAKQSNRLLQVIALAVIIFGIFWVVLNLIWPAPDLDRANEQAANLRAIILKEPAFGNVTVSTMTDGRIVVWAPEALTPSEKAKLEEMVVNNAPPHTGISYLVPIPDASATPSLH